MLRTVERFAAGRRWIVTAALVLVAACSGPDESTPSATADAASATESLRILRRGNGPEPETLDPQKARQDSSLNILRDLFEGLTSLDRDANVVPGAAETWAVSDDGLIYTFTLREGLTWANGDPLVAADFRNGMRRLVDPATASAYANILAPVENAARIVAGALPPEALGVEAPDERTLVIRLAAPAPYVLGLLAHPSTFPVHGPSLDLHGDDFARPGNLVSNGAFVLTEWVLGSHVAAQRNPRYRSAGDVRLDGVRYYHMADAGSELRRYRAGELDVTYTIANQQYEWLKENLGDQLEVGPQLSVYYYGFNLTRPPFRDAPELRKALSLALDRERIVRQVTGLGELPACSWIPDGVADYTPQRFEYCDWPVAQRLAEARRLYAAAGYSAERPLRIEIRYNTGEVHNRIAVAVAAMWKEALGVESRLHAEEFRVLNQTILARDVTEVFRSSWIGDYNDPWTFAQLLQSDFGINLTGYSSPDYDALLAEAAAAADPAERRRLLEQAERTMLADHPLLPIYFFVNKHLVAPHVRGFSNNVMNVQYSKDLWFER
ncbi:MAG TPA: peptide ABC transporter substrate-binding protein [Steroidobacteraceae bacterium]|nr:peptide ABC transporter substrate-binding protein [Steroidobacteraceae bacterium]